MSLVEIIVKILSGLVIVLPLVVELVKYVKEAIKSRNWNQVLKLVLDLMAEAEEMFANGSEKKEWVMAELKSLANTLNFDLDYNVISDLIDAIAAGTKKINV